MSNASAVLAHIEAADEPQSLRQIMDGTGLSAAQISAALLGLERSGRIARATSCKPHRYAAAEPARYQFFLDDDGDLQIALRDGSAEPLLIPRKEAARLASFLDRALGALEAA